MKEAQELQQRTLDRLKHQLAPSPVGDGGGLAALVERVIDDELSRLQAHPRQTERDQIPDHSQTKTAN